jgi:hypothetical protein
MTFWVVLLVSVGTSLHVPRDPERPPGVCFRQLIILTGHSGVELRLHMSKLNLTQLANCIYI